MVNDPVYIKQIIGFVQCLMIADSCICQLFENEEGA